MKPLAVGDPHTWGATVCEGGVNFALAAPGAQAVDLCLYEADALTERSRWAMQSSAQGVWHGLASGARVGDLYGFRVHGPWNPTQGQRFNPAKLVLDPCAKEVVGHYAGQDLFLAHDRSDPTRPDARDNGALAFKARVVAPLAPPRALAAPADPARRVIYELNVKSFTALHPDIPPELRGSYAGLAHPAALAHLAQLGVNCVSLMPVAMRADEPRLLALGLTNHWGYNPLAWNAVEPRYASARPGANARQELRDLIDALHAQDIEVLLDVVYNHTAESDEWGPCFHLRGIDNASYYRLQREDASRYENWSGCGNCLDLNQPIVLRTVMDSLRYWVEQFGVDGFRFDLAPILARGRAADAQRFDAGSAFLMALAQDPVLRRCALVAEPWDIGPEGYQLGRFPPGWLEWNDRFRDALRAFWLHAEGLGPLATRLAGSADLFAPSRGAGASVNFVCAHDGFTLRDLVSHDHRHNETNGEHNRDGHGHNLSRNHGVEGPSDDPLVERNRAQAQRALLMCTLLARGTPMILAGDELGHSQGGNNNAYCQDNASTWIDWASVDWALCDDVARMLRLRQARAAFTAGHAWHPAGAPGTDGWTAHWLGPDGLPMQAGDWHAPSPRSLMLLLEPRSPCPAPDAQACLWLIHREPRPETFILPPGRWWRHLSSEGAPTEQALDREARLAGPALWLCSTEPLRSPIHPSETP